MATANVRDVAALAGVSVGTVSNVLNQSKPVAPETAKRVLDAIDKLGFIRNDAARQLRVGQSRTVGIMVLDVSNPFFTDIARGVEDTLTSFGRSLILGNSAESATRELSYLDLFEEQRVSGLLITPVGNVLTRLERLRERGSPVVLVDRHENARSFSSVSVDDHRGGQIAAEHLLDGGRTSIAFVGGPRAVLQVAQRSGGAQDAVRERGARPLRVLELDSMRADAGRVGAEQLLALPAAERPDAVFAANDLIALGVLQALTHAGVRVPDDIAIIGYDDIYFAANAAIPISSIRQPAWEMGRTATELLMAEIDAPRGTDFRHVVFQPELIVRESTSRP
ncbi:LacI family DNA-binding transcriptional regulator [Herbiconiux sp. P16]|uniref:LacI family DNA-binding transcriptional regulator n=1 Tax=Herbiconiux wuyangfengii TaxID=3342794 RepID=UPI0035B8D68C